MQELQITLDRLWKNGKLPQSSVIKSHKYRESEFELMNFIQNITKSHCNVSAENNTDICVIKILESKNGDSQKYISVEQIRNLQSHFSSTGGLSPYKFALIVGAELMNLNASNCLLKILEDTPEHGYIFLITSHYNKLIPTIKSRCVNIYDNVFGDINRNHDYKSSVYRILNPEVRFEDKANDINLLVTDKTINIKNSIQIISDVIYEISTLTNVSNPDYQALYEYVERKNIYKNDLYNYYTEAKKLLLATEESFLDLRQIMMILISKFMLL